MRWAAVDGTHDRRGLPYALRSAGADDEKARAAATAVAESDRDVADLRFEMSGVRTEMADMRGDVRPLKWMVGFTMALVVGVLGTVLRMLQIVG